MKDGTENKMKAMKKNYKFKKEFTQNIPDGKERNENFNKLNKQHSGKWYDELKNIDKGESEVLPPEQISSLKSQASSVFNNAVILNKSSEYLKNE